MNAGGIALSSATTRRACIRSIARTAIVLATLLVTSCAGSKISVTHSAQIPPPPVARVAVAPKSGAFGQVIALSLVSRGITVIPAHETAAILVQAGLQDSELTTANGFALLRNNGIDAVLTVEWSIDSEDGKPEAARVQISDTLTGRILVGIAWQNGWAVRSASGKWLWGGRGSVYDNIMRKNETEAANEIAQQVVKFIQRGEPPEWAQPSTQSVSGPWERYQAAPTASPTPVVSIFERRALPDELEQFYAAFPKFEDRKPCVMRVFATLSAPTWADLYLASSDACFPGKTWVYVGEGKDGKSLFIDSSRIEAREKHQVTFWTMREVFDGEHDFVVTRWVGDCDARLHAILQSAWLTTGQYGYSGPTPVEWESVFPGSLGEATLNAACRYRAAVTKPRVPRPKPRSRKGNRPPKTPSPDSGNRLPLFQPL
jgi:hypothetical protein